MAAKQKIFGPDDPWQDFVTHCRQWDIAVNAVDPDESKCTSVTYARGLGDMTLAEGIEHIIRDDACNIGWILWLAVNFSNVLPGGLVTRMCEGLAARSSGACAFLYKKNERLTAEQMDILATGFLKEMPQLAGEVEARSDA